MKRILGLIATAVFVAGVAGSAHALNATTPFTLQATMASVSAVNIVPSSVDSVTGKWSTASSTLSFDTMEYKTFTDTTKNPPVITNSWLPTHYFALDIGGTGYVANTTVAVKYAETTADNPNSALGGHGLGWKATVTFMKATGTGETAITTHGSDTPKTGKMLLKDIALTGTAGEVVTNAEVAGGWLRLYIGIVSKDPLAKILDPLTGEVFTNADAPGAYKGTLTISATLT